MELATSIVDLVKADTDLMEKAGARNSQVRRRDDPGDARWRREARRHLRGRREQGCAGCHRADRDRLAKAVEGAMPQGRALTKSIETLQADGPPTARSSPPRKLGSRSCRSAPSPPKGVVIAVDKEHDGTGPNMSAKSAWKRSKRCRPGRSAPPPSSLRRRTSPR
jgi:hypothetical protein